MSVQGMDWLSDRPFFHRQAEMHVTFCLRELEGLAGTGGGLRITDVIHSVLRRLALHFTPPTKEWERIHLDILTLKLRKEKIFCRSGLLQLWLCKHSAAWD
ncbi:hypothetical protein AVEN_259750-1 [Araneus ventricosus]|uniref:Uncharacterized protein n=1 Tax=Araneus ventricosus TaxID=182803 RepID=A0A4Y2D4N5_ARAVE|nr:hypothetical protein AVEN_259750-1 [Araneus ventricosus]